VSPVSTATVANDYDTYNDVEAVLVGQVGKLSLLEIPGTVTTAVVDSKQQAGLALKRVGLVVVAGATRQLCLRDIA
jgi:hypothetical protein